jgi:Amt family ammonium transporter
MIFATLFVGLAYPTAGSWKWGTGWLDAMGFYDFAGSSIVHAFGGFGALACVLVLGPRKGKYTENGLKPIPASNFPLATIGVFLLFLGWFGFNGGSVLSADPRGVAFVCVTTALAAASGALASMACSYFACKKPDLSMALNGILAGLVGITAGADSVGILDSIIIGLVAGSIVVYSILFFDKMKIDDPVGAISVHGVCGIWGTLAVGIFNETHSVGTQLIGTLSYSAFAFVFAYVVFSIIKSTIGVRVSEEEEERGLDISEHGQEAYGS